jgi:hypothetical protein
MVWVLFNGRHLPKETASSLRTSLLTSAILIVFISLFPQVSGLGHLGGALFGAAAAVLLHLHRWKTGPIRWLALAGVVALPYLGLYAINRARASDPRWRQVEQRVFVQHYLHRIRDATGDAREAFRLHIAPVYFESPPKRNEAMVRRALENVKEQRPILLALAADLTRAGPYYDADTEHERESSLQRVQEIADKLGQAQDVLERNVNAPEREEKESAVFSRQFLTRIRDSMRRAITLSQGGAKDLLMAPPRERDRGVVAIALTEIKAVTRELSALNDALSEVGPFGSEDLEHARQTAKRYTEARLGQMNGIARCLRAGDKWTPEDEQKLQKQADEAAASRAEWEKLLESEAGKAEH